MILCDDEHFRQYQRLQPEFFIKGNKLNKPQERCSYNAANKDIGTVFKLQLQRRSHKGQVFVQQQKQQQALQREI